MKTFEVVFIDCQRYGRTMYVQHLDKGVLTSVLDELLSGIGCTVTKVDEADPHRLCDVTRILADGREASIALQMYGFKLLVGPPGSVFVDDGW